jgi:hypothetical protein
MNCLEVDFADFARIRSHTAIFNRCQFNPLKKGANKEILYALGLIVSVDPCIDLSRDPTLCVTSADPLRVTAIALS